MSFDGLLVKVYQFNAASIGYFCNKFRFKNRINRNLTLCMNDYREFQVLAPLDLAEITTVDQYMENHGVKYVEALIEQYKKCIKHYNKDYQISFAQLPDEPPFPCDNQIDCKTGISLRMTYAPIQKQLKQEMLVGFL